MIREEKRNWLKSADVKNGDVLTILSEGEIVTSPRYTYKNGEPKKDFIIKVNHNDKECDFTVNATNDKTLIKSFGKDTKLWLGKTIIVNVVDMMVSGSMKKSIVVQGSVDTKNTQYEA